MLFFPNKILSPALVIVEFAINSWMIVLNRGSLTAARRRAIPILVGLIPGIAIGSFMLSSVNPEVLKFCTYLVLLPLILSQAAGYRRPINAERAAGVPLGLGVGMLYSTTTISGPPLALMFNNQGIDKIEFRAALATVRAVETTATIIAYSLLGLFSSASVYLVLPVAPAVLLGLPLGTWLIRRVPSEPFRRVCMSFDAWVVGFGLIRTLVQLRLLAATGAYAVFGAVALFDLFLLYRYFVADRIDAGIGRAATACTAETAP